MRYVRYSTGNINNRQSNMTWSHPRYWHNSYDSGCFVISTTLSKCFNNRQFTANLYHLWIRTVSVRKYSSSMDFFLRIRHRRSSSSLYEVSVYRLYIRPSSKTKTNTTLIYILNIDGGRYTRREVQFLFYSFKNQKPKLKNRKETKLDGLCNIVLG